MNRTFLLAAAFLLTGQAALALTSEQVISDLRAQGYTRIEVRNGVTQTKVEAIRGTEKLEVVYDRATGAVLKSETEVVGRTDNTSPGISVRNRNRDFVRLSSGDDDGSSDDSRGKSDNGSDDVGGGDDSNRSSDNNNGSNDDSSNDSGSDDNGSDDSGSDDSGSDDGSSDDNGSDSSGSDDSGDDND